MNRPLASAFLCGLAGFFAWLATEPFMPRYIPSDPSQNVVSSQGWFVLLIGALVGGSAGFLQGRAVGGRRRVIESVALGLIFGSIGSSFGAGVGGALTTLVMHVSPGEVAYMQGPSRIVARALSLLPMGALMGLAIGATLRSKRGLLAGLLGGALGGAFVGLSFDLVAELLSNFMATADTAPVPKGMVAEIGGPSRAVMAAGLGAFVGLFFALIDQATRQAWVRLVVGRNEGKEWPIDNQQTTFGRDERADVPLFGDMNVAPLHAVLYNQHGQYVVRDQNTHIGIGHNNVRVGEVALNDGDYFQIGSHTMQFLMKESAARAMYEGRSRAIGAPTAPAVASHQQPYVAGGTSQPFSPAAQPHVPALTVIAGPLTGQRFEVHGPLEVGREAQGINLSFDVQSSRRHAVFSPLGATISVQDLGSTNGTMVNGARVSSAQLKPGDAVQIGNTIFRVE